MPLFVTEYAVMARAADGPRVMAGQEPALAEQRLSITGVSTQSAAFNAGTQFVMLHASEPAYLAFGVDPQASADFHRIGAGETRFYGVGPGLRIAVIAGA